MSRMSVADLHNLVISMATESNENLSQMQARIVELEGQVAKLTVKVMAQATPRKSFVPDPQLAKAKYVADPEQVAKLQAANAAWRAKCDAAKAEAIATGKRVSV